MKNKKAQAHAVMEFLMTYGWAILSAVIVVGVLWYFIIGGSESVRYDWKCISEIVCENVGYEFEGYYNLGNQIECRFMVDDGVYYPDTFDVNRTRLIELYGEQCLK
jgi:hypothetical protein